MFRWLRVWWNIRRLRHKNSSRRTTAAEKLGELGDARAVDPLIKALEDRDSDVPRAAADALGELGDPRAVRPLKEALFRTLPAHNPHSEFLEEVSVTAEALARLGEPQWLQYVKDRSVDCIRLREGNDQGLRQMLVQMLSSPYGANRTDAARALDALGEPKWALWVKGDADDWSRPGRSGDAEAVIPLALVLTQGDVQYRDDVVLLHDCHERAAEALGHCADSRVVEPLMRALRSPRGSVRISAARSLTKVASVNPSWIGNKWREVHDLITAPRHTWDESTGLSSDCTSRHHDTGIGLDFPDPPAGDF